MFVETKKHTKMIRLLADRVLAEIVLQEETKTTGGIIIPAANTEEAPVQGKIVAVSKRVEKNENEEDKVEVGQVIIFSKFAGSDISMEGKSYKVLRITDIFGEILPKQNGE